jgi:hypothetical protein
MPNISDALALRATAAAIDTQRRSLPGPASRSRMPDLLAVARQISQLGKLITDLGDEVLFRSAERDRETSTGQVVTSFASALRPVGEAASSLGEVAHQLAFLDRTEHLRNQPDARDAGEAAVRVIDDALDMTGLALREAAGSLHAASAAMSPPSVRLQAARSRSSNTVAVPGPVPPAALTTSSPDRIARSR